jgi:hypothetical protein
MYIALFYVDGVPVLKEHMISESIAGYIETSRLHPHLATFVLDYATP